MTQPSPRALGRTAACLTLLMVLAGCYRWELTSLELQRREARRERLRVELTNGEQLIVEQGVVTRDSVVGAGSAVAADRVAGLAARRLDRTITGFMALGLVVPIVAIVAVTTTNTCGAGAAPSC
jgi:hypothetical protein